MWMVHSQFNHFAASLFYIHFLFDASDPKGEQQCTVQVAKMTERLQ